MRDRRGQGIAIPDHRARIVPGLAKTHRWKYRRNARCAFSDAHTMRCFGTGHAMGQAPAFYCAISSTRSRRLVRPINEHYRRLRHVDLTSDDKTAQA